MRPVQESEEVKEESRQQAGRGQQSLPLKSYA
jgi:hypothetical protein